MPPPTRTGVLDPTCGSGTFLYQAARRILAAVPRYLPNANAQMRARIVSHLVHGIDIHPVAVEMSRATLRRALPAPVEPSVHQGDALLMSDASSAGLTGHIFHPNDSEFVTEDGKRRFHVPHSFIDVSDFASRLDALVQSAADGLELPASVTFGLDEESRQWIDDAHQVLTEIIAEHGDGVWAWYIRNQLMPRAIARRKVDRIVANPPWLRWNEIQTEPRKSNFKTIAQARGILPCSQGARSGFDIAGAFVVETRNIYLAHPSKSPSAYILNAAALRAKNWKPFRDQGYCRGTLELSETYADDHVLRTKPFRGAHACIVGLSNVEGQRLVLVNLSNYIKPFAQQVSSDIAERISSIPELPWSGSLYERYTRNGTTLGPQNLVVLSPADRKKTHLSTKAKKPWKSFGQYDMSMVPKEWIVDFIDVDNIEPFYIRPPLSRAVIPNHKGRLLSDAEARKKSIAWTAVSDVFERKRPRGESSPKDLATKLNFRGQLDSQWPPALSVIYNKSGTHIQACVAKEIIENKLYRITISSEAEGDYLCAVLNAPSLRFAFQFARNTDRDFHKTPLKMIPIPLYYFKNPDHQRLAELAAEIREARADNPVFEYPEACRGQLAEIDEIIARMLPDFARV